MKRAYLILVLVAVLCIACKHQPMIDDSCKIVPKGAKIYDLCIDQHFVSKVHDTIIGQQKSKYTIINISLWIRNNSDSTLKYIDMTCEWEMIFKISNKKINFLGHDCDSNYPAFFLVSAHQMKRYNFNLTIKKDSIYSPFKIGMDLIKRTSLIKSENKVMSSSSFNFIVDERIWSNPVKVP